VDRVTVDKAIMDERATEEADAKKPAAAGVAEKPITESVGPNPTLAPVVGSKRAATQSDSTPPWKWFHGAWKQRYIVLF
jgi:hypothetical protein